jgi:Xaa-Pro aminopeptidase
MRKKILFAFAVWFLSGGFLVFSFSPAVSKSEFAERRSRLMEQIPDSVAIILGATSPISDHQFFQNNDFYYFCGVEVPDAILVIDGMRKESALF